ncbi:MAG: glycosyltransferase [Planctomycetota bacterium]
MRIARVLTRMNLGGPARQVLASDPRLMARGHELRLFVGRPEPGEGDLVDAARARGLDVRRVPELARGPNPVRDLRGRAALRAGLGDFAPDVIHTHAAKAGALGRMAGWSATDAPLVHTFHGHVLEGYFPRFVARRMAAFERTWAGRCTRVLTVSEATAADLVRLDVVPRERLTIVPPGLDLDALLELDPAARTPAAQRLRTSWGCDERDFVVLFLGRLAAVKRPLLGLRAFLLFAARHERAQLVVAGDGDERAMLEAELERTSPALRARVRLLGPVDDVLDLHGAADVALSSSRNEGLPVALVEAAAAGRPAVAPTVGGVPELVEHGHSGLLVDAARSEQELAWDLADALAALGAQPERCRELGQRARERVRERHGAEALTDRLEQIYQEAVAEGRRLAS